MRRLDTVLQAWQTDERIPTFLSLINITMCVDPENSKQQTKNIQHQFAPTKYEHLVTYVSVESC